MKNPTTFKDLLYQEIAKHNKHHDPSTGRFTYAPGGSQKQKSAARKFQEKARTTRQYGSTGCGDAVAEIAGGRTNSLDGHVDKNGNLTPEREALHKEIIDNWLAEKMPAQGKPQMRMLGGGPAAGKSSVANGGLVAQMNGVSDVTVNPDDFKEMLPGYSDMASKTDKAASHYHEESSALAKRAYEVALNEGYNVVYDGTGDGSVKSVEKKIKAARDKGYEVNGVYVTVDTEEAVIRSDQRYESAKAKGENPRRVPHDYIRSCHAKVTDISVECAPMFDSIEIYDNNGPKGSTKLIAKGGNGQHLTAVDEPAFRNYLAKGSNGLDGFITLPNGQVIPVK